MARTKNKELKNKMLNLRITISEYKEIEDLVKKYRLATHSHFLRNSIYFYKEYLKRRECKE